MISTPVVFDACFTPEWVHHSVFYQIFPDRFASSSSLKKPGILEPWNSPPTASGFKGGDLLGVYEKLDYLQDLGINALYLNPIFQSASNHRYHTHDYLRVDPLLGGDAAFKKLLYEAHRRRIKVILDGVFNHASRGFFPFNHILENGASSPYLDWFRVHKYPLHAYEGKPNYDCWWGLAALPEFNTKNPQVREYIFDVARYWLDMGIDGWRLDVPDSIDDDSFWQEFRQIVRVSNPDAYLVGEIAGDATRWLQGDQFDGVMNYLLTYLCWGFFAGKQLDRQLVGHWFHYASPMLGVDGKTFLNQSAALLDKYPRPAGLAQMNLLDSHDTARFLSLAGGNKDRLRLALLFLMTYPGAPCVYYGDEIGLEGGHDPDCRRTIPADDYLWDLDLRDFYKKCIETRHAHPALQTGNFIPVYAEGNVIAYRRELSGEELLIGINCSDEMATINLLLENDQDGTLVLVELMDGRSTIEFQGGGCKLKVPPISGKIYRVEKSLRS